MACNMSFDKNGKIIAFVCTKGNKVLTKEEMEERNKKLDKLIEEMEETKGER